MKKICLLLLLALPAAAHSQSVLDRVRQKARARVDQKVDQGIEKSLDEAEKAATAPASKKEAAAAAANGTEEGEATPAVEGTGSAPAAAAVSFRSYSRYDFVPCTELVYAEDFGRDAIGEFPLGWGTNNRGEAVTIKGMDGQWLQLFKEGRFLSPYVKGLPANFTFEFDLVLHLPPNEKSTNYPEFTVRLLGMDAGDDKGRKLLNGGADAKVDTRIVFDPFPDDYSHISIFSEEGRMPYFSKERKPLPKLGSYVDKRIHLAVWVQGERLRLWINGEKIYDLPQALPEKASFNRIEFATGGSVYTDEEVGYYVSNIRVAQGAADLRTKLLNEGRFSTTGILFDVDSDKIRPESAGVLGGIAKLLQENPDLRLKIIGHTDADGNAVHNQTLSKLRAAAVVRALNAEYGIAAARLQADGKGAAQPVADNTSREGKAKNRRVEFIKL
ncbi:MAG: OmpA family protein [Chitinophagaceae bacterium]|nr:MAG: OmpA family protein [Chitinophagaceae bacterium]